MVEPHYFRTMDALGKHCKANHFAAEKPKNDEFSSWCNKGRNNLPLMTPPLEYVKNLYFKNTIDSKNSKENKDSIIMLGLLQVYKWQLWNYY